MDQDGVHDNTVKSNWEILRRGSWVTMLPVFQQALEEALELGHDTVEYNWPCHEDPNSPVWKQYELDLTKFVQTSISTGAKHSIRRVLQPPQGAPAFEKKTSRIETDVDNMCTDGHGVSIEDEWQIMLYGEWRPMQQQLQEAIKACIEKGGDVVQYCWPNHYMEWIPYEFDLKKLSQTNVHTGVAHDIRVVRQPTVLVDHVVDDSWAFESGQR